MGGTNHNTIAAHKNLPSCMNRSPMNSDHQKLGQSDLVFLVFRSCAASWAWLPDSIHQLL